MATVVLTVLGMLLFMFLAPTIFRMVTTVIQAGIEFDDRLHEAQNRKRRKDNDLE